MNASPPSPPDAALPRMLDVAPLQQHIARFARERQWERFHSPKNLAMALSAEVGELTEIFQWLSEEASKEVAARAETARPVRDELADVFIYLVRLASVLGVDLDEAVRSKLMANEARFPVEQALLQARRFEGR